MAIYRKSEINSRMAQIYAEKLARWPAAYESRCITTCFGRTHVLACGPVEAPPLLLLHGLAITSMMWLPNIAALSERYRCYAVDVIGDYGRSELSKPWRFILNAKGYSRWLDDVLDGLGIERTHMVGASNGGFITLCQAIYAPERVDHIVLLAPAGLNLTIKQILPRIFAYLLFPSDVRRARLIEWFIGDHPSVRAANHEQLWWGMQRVPRVAIPLIISRTRLRQIKAQSLFIFGEYDQVIPAETCSRRVTASIPQAQVQVIPGAGHALNCEAGQVVDQHILNFLAEV
ncbi:alpha/beta fold hydrolase [Chloroflexota bacterium]